MQGALKVNWDAYWQGFMSNPLIEALRFDLVKNAYQKLLESILIPPGSHFCELGAGTGKVSLFLGLTYNADITIVDNNKAALAINRVIFKDFPGLHQQIDKDALELSGMDQQFDMVHSGGLIEHFVGEARERIIAVHAGLVKPGGYMIILVPVRNVWYKILNEGFFKFLHLLDQIPEEPWTITELNAALKRHGFEILRSTFVVTELGVIAQKKGL